MVQWTNEKFLKIALEQHAIDCNCSPSDFLANENIYVESKKLLGARRYLKNLPFALDFVYYGKNMLVSGNKKYFKIAKKSLNNLKNNESYRLFLEKDHNILNKKLKSRGLSIRFVAEYFLPEIEHLQQAKCSYPMRVLEQGEFSGLYCDEWGHALCADRKSDDMLVVVAIDKDKIIGVAGCSADCDTMWQIGIDVLPEYRRQGVATALTTKLALEILQRDKVPYYCAAWSNIPSVKNAIRSGFRPAWIEMTAVPWYRK